MKKARRVAVWLCHIAAVLFGYLAYVYLTLPDVRPLASTNPASTAFIELRAREAESAGRAPRAVQRWVPYGRISPTLKRAVVVTEDAAFWQHEGVDYRELRNSIELNLARGEVVRGASTITQQLAKNLYLNPSRNPVRKIRELIIARRLEAELTKTRILEVYLNVIEWGDGIYGAEAAARTYFGKPASALGSSESALLAGAIINPRVHNPSRPSARLLARQQIVLKLLRATSDADEPRGTPPVEVLPPIESAPLPIEAPPPEPPIPAIPVPEIPKAPDPAPIP